MDSLYTRLGGYDAISAVVEELLPRLMQDPQLGRFWAHRGDDGIAHEKQLLKDYLCASAGGPTHYSGRDMLKTHKGMRIDAGDWTIFRGHVNDTLTKFNVPAAETADVNGFLDSLRDDVLD